jgi:anti-sigma factor (TIGR02949 family)
MAEPIDCTEAKAQLQDFLRRELTPDVEQEMRVHIDRCRHCFQHYRFEANFFLMLETSVARQPCPDSLRKRILDLLRAEARRG